MNRNKEIGSLTVYWGGMFSGKTTRLINQLIQAKEGAICFKPSVDTREDSEIIKTHDGIEFPATPISSASMIFLFLDNQITTIGIEEASLFMDDPTLVPTIQTLRDMGYKVIVTGLDLTAEDKPFGQMPVIAAISDEAIKLRSNCHACGEVSSLSFYTGGSKATVEIGGSDKYVPLCRNCFYSNKSREVV